MPKRACYFKCKYDGQLYSFPPVTYSSYEKYFKWKNILRKEDKEKDDQFIVQNFKLCSNHFEKYYFSEKNRLMRHAVPTLNCGITMEQEKLLCTFVEENPDVIIENFNDPTSETVKTPWITIEPKLNALGPKRSNDAWAEYLCEIMSNLKTKRVTWECETSTFGVIQKVKNANDFTDLELRILQLWRNETSAADSLDLLESDFREENDIYMEYIIKQDEDSDDSRESNTGRINRTSECSIAGTSRDKTSNEIVTFTFNVATGGNKPLLQAAGIAPRETPKTYSKVKCKCIHSPSKIQDEFDAFGKDIAQKLRSMPTQTAVETQKLLISVLRSKQSKILNDSFL